MYLLLAFAYQKIKWHIPHLIPSSTISDILISIKRSNYNLVFNFNISRHIFRFQKCSNTLADNNVLL